MINAYVEVAHSNDQIALAEAQKAAYKEQLTLNDRLMSAGEGTITDVSETQARYSWPKRRSSKRAMRWMPRSAN